MIKLLKEDQKCINCESEDFRFTREYCSKCYALILKIENVKHGILPDFIKSIDRKYYSFEKAKNEYVKQIKWRLGMIKDSHVFKKISAHDLEHRINGTLRLFGGKTLGKINDPIAFYLKDNKPRSYVYQIFSKIQLLKPFKIDHDLIYKEAKNKNI